MGFFAGTERQCTEDEHDDEDENDSQISEFGTPPALHIQGARPGAEGAKDLSPGLKP
jgi:hypothetical protein